MEIISENSPEKRNKEKNWLENIKILRYNK